MNNAVVVPGAAAAPALSLQSLVGTISDIIKRPSFRYYALAMAVSIAVVHMILHRLLSSATTSRTRSIKSSRQRPLIKTSSVASTSASAATSSSTSKLVSSGGGSGGSASNTDADDAAPSATSNNSNKPAAMAAATAAAAAAVTPAAPATRSCSNGNSSATRVRPFASGHERLGHVVTVRVKDTDATPDALKAAAMQFALTMRPPVHVVLSDTAGVQGELRQPTHSVLWADMDKALACCKEITDKIERRGKKLGVISSDSSNISASAAASIGTFRLTESILAQLSKSPSFTVHVENGIRYSLDSSRVMFSSGNTTERMHFGVDVNAAGETVVDMFAGIGYFTVPLSVCMNRPSRIIAIEKNPESCAYLACNTLLNDCVDRVVILNGDNRQVGGLFVGKCNRVLMGYIPSCQEFLPRAVSFLVQKKVEEGELLKQRSRSPAIAPQKVSFAPGSTPPKEKNGGSANSKQGGDDEGEKKKISSSPSSEPSADSAAAAAAAAAAESELKKKVVVVVDEEEKSASAPAAAAALPPSFPPLTSRPIGTIHYHYLAESSAKPQAAATAMQHLTEAVGPQLAALSVISQLRVVKSYAPKKFHCVADFVFAP